MSNPIRHARKSTRNGQRTPHCTANVLIFVLRHELGADRELGADHELGADPTPHCAYF
jgi:hypothetical protein